MEYKPNHSSKLMQLIIDGADEQTVWEAAMEAKRSLYRIWVEVVKDGRVIDSMVTKYVPDVEFNWVWGIVDPDNPPAPTTAATTVATAPTSVRPMSPADKKARILSLAKQLHETGEAVKSMAIVTVLKRGGDPTDERNLATAVGNTLSRNGWARVGDGEYEPAKEPEL